MKVKITLLAQELCPRLGERGRRGPHLQRGSGPSGLQPGRGFIFSRLRGGRPPPADCGRFRGFSGGPATWAPCPQRQRVPSPALLSVWQRTRSLPGATHGPPRRPPRALTEKCLGLGTAGRERDSHGALWPRCSSPGPPLPSCGHWVQEQSKAAIQI